MSSCAAPVEEKHNVVFEVNSESCSPGRLASLGGLDVAIAIDTSLSTREPTGFDVDGDGSVGEVRYSNITDRGDSTLGAQITAIRPLVEYADEADIQFSIVSYSGPSNVPRLRQAERVIRKRDSRVRADLTKDVPSLLAALDDIQLSGSRGTSNYVAGMRTAIRSLTEARDPDRKSRRVVLFISDSAGPIMREPDRRDVRYDVRMKHAAKRAIAEQIIFNTFGVGPEADEWRLYAIGRLAGATGGDYHPVDDPQQLFCHLASSLVDLPTIP